MAIKVIYPNGATVIISGAITVDQQNFHEGMYDFYDDRGVLLEQVGMGTGIRWELVAEPEGDID